MKYSFSSEEDINELLNTLDIISEGIKDGNEDMLLTMIMFDELVETIKKPIYIVTMKNIIIGNTPMQVSDHGKSVEQVSSEKIGISLEEFNKGLKKNIKDIIKNNRSNWEKYINERYKNIYFNYTDDISNEWVGDILNPQDGIILTYKRDSVMKELSKEDEETLNGLISYQKELEELINSGDLSDREVSRLTTMNISIRKDIYDIRKTNGEVFYDNRYRGKRQMVSYEREIRNNLAIHNQQNEERLDDQNEDIVKQENIKKIKNIAKEKLTTRQYIIFQLYYLNGMTQQEVANIIGLKQPYIVEASRAIIKRISKNM